MLTYMWEDTDKTVVRVDIKQCPVRCCGALHLHKKSG